MRFSSLASAAILALSAYAAVTPAAKPAVVALKRSDSCSGSDSLLSLLSVIIRRVTGSTSVNGDLTAVITDFTGHTSASAEDTVNTALRQIEDLAATLTISLLSNGTTIADLASEITATLQDLKVTFADNGNLTSALGVATNIVAETEGIATSFLASHGNLTVLLGSADVVSNVLGELASVVQSVAAAVPGSVLVSTIADVLARFLGALQVVLSSKVSILDKLSAVNALYQFFGPWLESAGISKRDVATTAFSLMRR